MNDVGRLAPVRLQSDLYATRAEAAWTEGQACLMRGEFEEALRWLDRAHRIAPEDANIRLSLAAVTLQSGEPVRAAGLFRSVAERLDLREAWLGLAAALRAELRADEAAGVIGSMLARHLIPPEPGIAAVVAAVVAAAGAPGWCCIETGGALRVETDGRPVVTVDGQPWRRRARLPDTATSVGVTQDGRDLLGSPLRPAIARRVEGFVEARDGRVEGWAWCPGSPETDPRS